MDKVLAIIKREYLTRVKSRAFLIWTVLTPLLGAALAFSPALFANRLSGKTKLAIVDQSGDNGLFVRVAKLLNETEPPRGMYELRLETLANGESLESARERLNRESKEGKLTGYVVVPPDVYQGRGKVQFYAASLRDRLLNTRLRTAFNLAMFEGRLVKEGVKPARAEVVMQPLEFEVISDTGDRNSREAFFLSLILLMLIYGMIIFYGTLVMRGVIEEKQSRIIEVLLSSVRPFQLMLGKLIGIGLVSLTQVLLWTVSALLLSALAALPMFAAASFKMPRLEWHILVFFAVYFVLGYFLYSTLYLIVGALVSAEEDAQQMMLPIVFSAVIPMLLFEQVVRQPNSLLSVLLSLTPIFSPILMFARIAVQTPPWWQIALSLILLAGTILGAVWLAAKIYRVGVLMYGKPPTLPELFRWLKYS
jgi:ABC-2 type transport system permease protein